MPTAARTHQSRERVFVVGLVTGEISGTVSGLVRAGVDGNVNLRVISGRIADGAAVSIPIFLGDFDGQGHKITGLRLTENCSEYGLFSRVESGASVRNLTVEGEVIPAGTQTDVVGIVGQMVADITLRFSSGGLDELQTELNALQSLINRTLDDAQSASDSVTGGVSRIAACADAAQSSAGALSGQLTDFVDANVSSVNNLLLIVERYTAKAAPILDDLSSAAGAAAPDTAQLRADIGALQAADGVPEELLHLTLRFAARGKVLKRQTFGYGDSFTADDFPEAPKKDGCYADWNVTDLSDLRFDTTVTAVYRPYVTALAAGDTEDGRPALLAEGLFRTGDTLQAVQADTADAPRGAAGVWTLTLPADGEESHTIRWHVPADGGWKKAQTSTVGSYLCFALPSDSAQFAVVPAMHAAWQLWAAIAAALTAIAAVITLVIRKRRAKTAKRAQ